MAKLTREELKKLRETKRADMAARAAGKAKAQVIVGMGTCGIAAGAKDTYDAIVKACAEFKIEADVEMRKTGCMGLCYCEPNVEVVAPGMPGVIYGKITADVAKDLVQRHLVEKALLDGHIYDRPAADICAKR